MSFAISNIKPGYLLRFTSPDGSQFNASVYPAASYDDNWGTTVEDGDLILRTEYRAPFKWIPVTALSEDLTYQEMYTQDIYSVDAIYGYAPPPFINYNTTTDRRCLWQRTPPKIMTIAQISAELGYEVLLLQDGVQPPPKYTIPRCDVNYNMMVVLRNGAKRLVMSGAYNHKYVLDPANAAAAEPFTHYDEELRYYNHQMKELDIMEVWSNAANPMLILAASEESRQLKWRRDESKYMTLDQICTALGYLVTITAQ
jgi:hypothetical protein